jgi:predicted CXXCH cytochrome family protein
VPTIVLIACFILASNPVRAQAKVDRPAGAIDPAGCVTSDCHVAVKSGASLHGPVANNACEACHEPIDLSKHTYRLTRDGAELCTYCHEFDVSDMPVVHAPVKKGECLGCHDPHGGADRSFTRERSTAELCGRCHESVTIDHKFLHTPVQKGQCDSCHPPHAAMFPGLLDAAGPDLCLACHDEFDMSLGKAAFVHKAMEQGCLKCHAAHGSNEPMQVVRPPADLCVGCHEKVKAQLAQATHTHSAATRDRACLTCHTAHGGDAPALMIDEPLVVCMECHSKEIRLDKKRVIPAVSELTDGAMHKHGAIRDGQCGGCHVAHGSDQPAMLAKVYRTSIYQAFAVQRYELCFGCHDVRLVQDQHTTTLTAFRNGERNLHWVHVKEGERGRACAVCHTTHASPNARNIRLTTPYKVWNMPIRFAKTETGGSCAPGCHLPWAYDREMPVAGPTTAPARAPAPAIARAAREGPATVSIKVTDVNGTLVELPDAARPALLLFVGTDAEANRSLLASVLRIVGDPARAPTAVVVILCGSDASSANHSAAGTMSSTWPIVVDEDRRVSGKLDVHGWPSGLIIRSDGTQVARIGGSPESFAVKLGAYLDVASGREDAEQVERRLARPAMIKDRSTPNPARQLQLARKLLDEGSAEAARKVLAEVLRIEPDSLPARVAMIEASCQLGRGAEAISMLGKVPPDALPRGRHDVLRARACILTERWAEARQLATRALQQDPKSPDAHFIMAQIHEREGDFRSAAAEYRAASEARGK